MLLENIKGSYLFQREEKTEYRNFITKSRKWLKVMLKVRKSSQKKRSKYQSRNRDGVDAEILWPLAKVKKRKMMATTAKKMARWGQ